MTVFKSLPTSYNNVWGASVIVDEGATSWCHWCILGLDSLSMIQPRFMFYNILFCRSPWTHMVRTVRVLRQIQHENLLKGTK